jgi:septal ring factor EnvC (AmiA/AmiB activator)
MGRTTDIDEKILSELKLMVKVGATPVECVKALEGKMSRSSVYKYHNKFNEKFEEPITNELSAKNEELHTQKVVIETLQEEIRVLNLELHKYKNDINSVLDDRQKLECLLSDNANAVEISKSKSEETGSIADFREIIEEMIQLYTRKNKDYGNAFKQSYSEFGSIMCAIRINDKLNRFKTLIKQNKEVKTESIKDTLIDLANYAVMTIIEIEREKNLRSE